MTVNELKKFLEVVPGDAEVFLQKEKGKDAEAAEFAAFARDMKGTKEVVLK
jgi:hypothetical protein